jgi:hypothetical protein
LLVDDSVEDSAPLQEHFGSAGRNVPIAGGAKRAYLRGDGWYRNRQKYPVPAAVLLVTGAFHDPKDAMNWRST